LSIIEKLSEAKNDVSLQEILVDLQNLEANLESKTHIIKPKQLAVLKVFANMLNSREMKREGKLLDGFISIFLKYMVSFDR